MRWRRGPEYADEYKAYYAVFGKRVRDNIDEYLEVDDSLTPRYWNPETRAYDLLAVWDPTNKCWQRP